MTRIDKRFAELRREGRAGLVTFITAGDPDYDTALAILNALPGAGADIIELGRELGPEATILVNLSGRGDKDMDTAAKYFELYDEENSK